MIIGGFSNYDLVNCLKIVKGDQGDKMLFFLKGTCSALTVGPEQLFKKSLDLILVLGAAHPLSETNCFN